MPAPRVPTGQTTVAGRAIRLGSGSVAVHATHVGDQYATTITIGRGVDASSVRLGHTLPRGSYPASVVLDGRAVQNYRVTQTNRGVEVTVATTPGQHTLRITT